MVVKVISGDHAVAWAARLARVEVVPAFPITPQTLIVEQIAEFVNNGELDADFIPVESEHSVMSVAVGASAGGVQDLHRHRLAGAGVDARDAIRAAADPAAGGHGQREPFAGSGGRHMARAQRLHARAGIWLAPVLRRGQPGGVGHDAPGVPHRRGPSGHAAGDDMPGRFRPVAHRGEGGRAGAGIGRRLPA